MKITVIGSTSRTGLLLLEEGLRRHHRLTAFTRRPEILSEKEKLAAIVEGMVVSLVLSAGRCKGRMPLSLLWSGTTQHRAPWRLR